MSNIITQRQEKSKDYLQGDFEEAFEDPVIQKDPEEDDNFIFIKNEIKIEEPGINNCGMCDENLCLNSETRSKYFLHDEFEEAFEDPEEEDNLIFIKDEIKIEEPEISNCDICDENVCLNSETRSKDFLHGEFEKAFEDPVIKQDPEDEDNLVFIKDEIKIEEPEISNCDMCDENVCLNSEPSKKIKKNKKKDKKEYKCPFCNKVFNDPSNFNRHKKIHTGYSYSFECNICHKKFKTPYALKVHLSRHTGEGLYECKICDRRFYVQYDLDLHVRSHTGERPFKCQICEKNYISQSTLRKHLLVHSDERKHKCPKCPATFKRADGLKEHFDRQHKKQ
ncbi:zinc finger protein 714-like [Ctenocephalides felis]|uniref:zinc finger protein 714-like n=1 Tax=Ctenocephalides felis TaxID=7515 RepID=UPI000E6E3877|nr:zinc finger protein 714-like [Ctenocephalides felis]XP_026475928.1 zinc finger protein 714-like [Ctenocephalides felis]